MCPLGVVVPTIWKPTKPKGFYFFFLEARYDKNCNTCGYYRKRAQHLFGAKTAEERAEELEHYVQKALFSGKIEFSAITENDFKLDIKQKAMDMKLGTDIASMVLKKQVDQIILIAGDSDFVPAAKLARREGADFILDPMGLKINPDLSEHIDGIRSKVSVMEQYTSKSQKLSATHTDALSLEL